MRRVLITGTAGFIGFHLGAFLLREGVQVFGYDAMTDYYDVTLKRRRHQILSQNENFSCREADLCDLDTFDAFYEAARPDVIVHLAAQAGVRYSLESPRTYIDSNLVGTFHVLECARRHGPQHLLLASTSSVYGANTEMPFTEDQKTDTQLTLYASTKKATESMAHSYAHLFGIPTTMFRFFTVYGPWGRPDMALFKFVKAGLESAPIDVYNHGRMERDFTYVDDLVRAVALLIDVPPPSVAHRETPGIEGDSLSEVAPYRIVNIGNSTKVSLLDFIIEIEAAIGRPIKRRNMEMQPGDVPSTWADCSLLNRLTGFRPDTPLRDGVSAFVDWYRAYYQV